MTETMYRDLVEQVGERNAVILYDRYTQHMAGLHLMCQPYESHTHQVGPAKNVIEPIRADDDYWRQFGAFLDRMKAIEEDFISGRRKTS